MQSKVCVTCHKDQPLTMFNKRAAAKDGLQSRCRDCSRAWYLANRTAHLASVRRRNARHRLTVKAWIREYLSANPCVDCDEHDLRCLQFDDVDPSTKAYEISALLRHSYPLKRILLELEKCEVRCANCHSRRTAEMGGSWRQAAWLEDEAAMADEARARLEEVLARPAGTRSP